MCVVIFISVLFESSSMEFPALLLLFILSICGIFVLLGISELVHIRFFQHGETVQIENQRTHVTDGLILLGLITLCILTLIVSI